MPTLLHLDSSADLVESRSRAITRTFADAWRALGSDHVVVYRDLHVDPLPHLPDAALHWPARLRPTGANPPADIERLQQSVIEELLAADVVLIGAPMYNYSLASTLKVWVDYIHIPGVTTPFDVDAQPMVGRAAVVVTARGGSYDEGTPTATWDHAVPVLQLILGEKLGMNVTVVTTSLTLADTVPAMAADRERSGSELAAAHERAASLASSLGAIPTGAVPTVQ